MKVPLISALLCLSVLAGSTRASLSRRDHDAFNYFAIHVDPSYSPDEVAYRLGAHHEGQIGELTDHHTFSMPKTRGKELDGILEDLKLRRRRRRRRSLEKGVAHEADLTKRDALDGVLWSQKLILRPPMEKRMPPVILEKRLQGQKPGEALDPVAANEQTEISQKLSIEDPIFPEQWHLFNPVQRGHDLNVTGLWLEGITGNGSITAIVDDGLDFDSNDLKDNYFREGSYDFNNKQPDPRPQLVDDRHGTRCAGEVAAVRNDACGVGVAYDSKVAGVRILSAPITDEDEAASIIHGYQKNQIYSCSWGPPDDGRTMEAPGVLIKRAMVTGVQKGRDGKGSIYVFAAGNGAANGDNCNFDGYTNSIYSITVAAVDKNDIEPRYSERCSANMVVAYSSGSGDAIHTTDVGADQCYNRHGGTSAAGPLMAGVTALALSVRPDLGWRDMQYLALESALPFQLDDHDWQNTTIGKHFSHKFGYGKVDAYTLVHLAKNWKSVKPQAWYYSPWLSVRRRIPEGNKGITSTFEVKEDMMKGANIERLEHVQVTMNVNHTRRGDLSVELWSPAGVVSHLSVDRPNDDAATGYVDWTFMSVAHWGEKGVGNWTVIVKDTNVNEFNGTFIDWRLTLWGESIDGSNQPLHALPSEHEDDHEKSDDHVVGTASLPATATPTGTVQPHSEDAGRPTKPPVIASTTSLAASSTSLTSASASISSSASPTKAAETEPSSTVSPIPESEHFLPSFFPTFGVSKRTQVWIYGALGLICVFCAGLAAYFYIQRRKRILNNPRDAYEFQMVEDETHPLASRDQRRGQRRGGELYDAFAGESDEELLSDEDPGRLTSDSEVYRDEGHGRHSVALSDES